MTAPGQSRRPLRSKADAWSTPPTRPRLGPEELALLRLVAEEGETPRQALRRALRLAADQAAALERLEAIDQRLEAIEARLARAATGPAPSPPPPAPAAEDPVVRAAAAILRWQGDDDDEE